MGYDGPMKKTLSFLLLATLALSLYAGPFGLDMDWSLEELASSAEVVAASMKDSTGSVLYQVLPPSPEDPYTIYFAEVNDTFGLWRITAMTEPVGDIKEITQAFNEALAAVSSYGEPLMDSDTFIKLSSPELFTYLALGETYAGAVLIPDPPVEDFAVLSLSVESDDGETGYILLDIWSFWLAALVSGMY